MEIAVAPEADAEFKELRRDDQRVAESETRGVVPSGPRHICDRKPSLMACSRANRVEVADFACAAIRIPLLLGGERAGH